MLGESRVLRVYCRNSQLSVVVAPPVVGALGVIGLGGITSLINILKVSLWLTEVQDVSSKGENNRINLNKNIQISH